jgi:hypothetical protein
MISKNKKLVSKPSSAKFPKQESASILKQNTRKPLPSQKQHHERANEDYVEEE